MSSGRNIMCERTLTSRLVNVYVSRPEVSTAKVSQYADDIAINTSSNNRKNATFKLQKALNSLDHWCNLCRIKIKPDKTNFILLTRNSEKNLQILLKGVKLSPTKTTRFLRVELNNKLTGAAHIRKVETKLFSRINGLLMLKAKGVSSKCLLMLYRLTIRPILQFTGMGECYQPQH